MSHPVRRGPVPVESMMATDAASRALGITLLDYGDGWARATMNGPRRPWSTATASATAG